ncbi:MAG: hypothetical protein IJE08_05680 [Clostridia bacterium]|nr:hypothetical protein [Clostridia bacterium]
MQKRIMTVLWAAAMLILTGCAQEAASVGVIGGADGPTVVMVSVGDGFWLMAAAVLLIAAGCIAAAVILIRRRRKKH